MKNNEKNLETKKENKGAAKEIFEIKSLEDRINDLIKIGKEKKFITFEQLADALKGLDVDNDSLDEIYNTLMENDIQVVADEDETTDEDGVPKIIEEDPIILDDAELTKDININDPLRMYLRRKHNHGSSKRNDSHPLEGL